MLVHMGFLIEHQTSHDFAACLCCMHARNNKINYLVVLITLIEHPKL